jgi:hypothetical protein
VPRFHDKVDRPITMLEVGNLVVAPLVGGLETSIHGKPKGDRYRELGTQIPLGTHVIRAMSFSDPMKLRHKPRRAEEDIQLDDPEPQPEVRISSYTQGLAILHKELVSIGYHMGKTLDVKATLPELKDKHLIDHLQEHAPEVTLALTPERLLRVPITISRGKDKPPITLEVPNVPVGKRGKSLAHVMMAIGLASETVAGRSRVVGNFMYDATGGFISTLPPLQAAIHKHLLTELNRQGHDGQKVLQEAGCDLNHDKVQKAFDIMLPYGELYDAACELRGQKGTDYVQKAFRQMRKFCSSEVQSSHIRDGYECAQVLEGMAAHAVARSTGREKTMLQAAASAFAAEAADMLRVEPGGKHPPHQTDYMPSAEEVMALPSAKRVLEAFADCYAADILQNRSSHVQNVAWDSLHRPDGNRRG